MSITRHTTYNIIGALIPAAVTLLTVPLYLKIIGIERYGVLALCWLMLGYIGFLNLGLGPAVAQKLASLRSQDASLPNKIFWTALWLNLLMGLIAALAVYLLAGLYFDQMEDLSPVLRGELKAAIPVLSSIIPLVMLNGVLVGALQGRERFLVTNAVSVVTTTLMATIPLGIAVLFGPFLPWLIFGALFARSLAMLLLFRSCVVAVPLSRPHMPSPELLRSLLSFGGWIMLTSIAAPILATVDRFAIGSILGAAAVAIYTIPYNVVSRIAVVPQALSAALFPRFAAAEDDDVPHLEGDAMRALACIVTPIVVALIALGRPFLNFWIGPEIGSRCAPIFYILLFGFWINSFARIALVRLQGTGRPDVVAKLHIAELLPYFGILILAISHYGVVGAALAWTIRTAGDAIAMLFVARVSSRVVWPMLVPAAVTLCAVGFAWAVSVDDPVYWILLPGTFAVAVGWSVFTMPPPLKHLMRRMLPWLFRPRKLVE